jgi:hypothetical protein
MEALGKFTAFIIVMILTSILGAYTLSTLWEWILIPIFSIKAITMGQAYGIALVKSYVFAVKPANDTSGKTESEKFIENIAWAIVINIFALLFGYIATFFI